jgi:hypothetical protein
MIHSYSNYDDKVYKAIERLLRTSGHTEWMIISVVSEARKYCFKKLSGEIGTVDIDFITDRINANLF